MTRMDNKIKTSVCSIPFQLAFFLADGEDYEAISSMITFQPEQVTEEVIVVIGDDQYAEPVEHFTMMIEAVEGGVAFPITEAIVHINDDDGQ